MILKPLEFNPQLNITKITSDIDLPKLYEFLERTSVLGWDIETTFTKDFFWRRCRTMQFGTVQEQYVVDLLGLCDSPEILRDCQGNYGKNLHLAPKLQKFIQYLEEHFCGKNILKVGVNLNFEYENTRWNFGLRPWNFFSCDMAERVIQAGDHSLKDYSYYSMEQMIARYFGFQIEKQLQDSFNLETPLTDEQFKYCAIDTRLPLGLRLKQLQTIQRDNLIKTVDIDNNAIGAFQDMHLHGERINRDKWKKLTEEKIEELKKVITELDKHFIPIVGNKNDAAVTEEEILNAEQAWKIKNQITQEELKVKVLIKQAKKDKNLIEFGVLNTELANLKEQRIQEKEKLKLIHRDLKKQRTKYNKLFNECQGDAFINYESNSQLLETLQQIKSLKKLKDTNDDSLVKYKGTPIIDCLRQYRELSKRIGTYGFTWITEWVTKPCKDEGWLHPGDSRLHSTFNQLDAETGRSTSDKPNCQNLPQDKELRSCFEADPPDEEEPEGYVIVTADMSGAELRIIAELANAKSWIDAFARDEDVHSVGTEILYPEQWPKLAVINGEVKGKPYSCEYYQLHTQDTVNKNPLCIINTPRRLKCECPEHKKLRDGNKSTNFLLAYGGTHFTLAERLGVTTEHALELMTLHSQKFPDIWDYLDKSGKAAKALKESRDMFGRRRLFPEPTWERAKQYAKEKFAVKLEYPEEIQKKHITNFIAINGRKPNDDEKWDLCHLQPSSNQIGNAYNALYSSIERQGKNHAIQGSNASIAKLAMGWGFDEKENKPYLWHILPQYKAKLLKFVHDELVVQCPKRYGKIVAEAIGDAFRRAGAERMTKVIMKFDYNIAAFWKK